MRHDPARYTFGMRYLADDLPRADRERLEALSLIVDATDLGRKHAAAAAWLERQMAELEIEGGCAPPPGTGGVRAPEVVPESQCPIHSRPQGGANGTSR